MAPFVNPAYPPKVHPENFRLSEYYYERDKGKETSRKTTLSERVERKGCDAGSASSMLSLDDGQKPGKVVDVGQKHRQALSRAQHHMKRLASTISSTEQQLPSLKRRIGEKAFAVLRKGVTQAREYKERCLDEMEDYKAVPDEQHAQDIITSLTEMNKGLQEHVGALVEAVKAMETSIIKQPPGEDRDSNAASSRS